MPSPLALRRLGMALLAGAALGCSDAGDSLESASALEAPLSCSGARRGGSSFSPCDIADAACQQRIAELAACQWGGPGTAPVRPVVRTLTAAQYRAELSQSAEHDEQTGALRAAMDTSLALLGLIQGGDLSAGAALERDAEDVLAYYDPASESITVIEPRAGASALEANVTLLHEMIHALQDHAHDLGALRGAANGSSDGNLALSSLIEGEAKLHDLLFLAGARGEPLTPELLQQQLEQRRALSEELLLEGPSVLASSLQAVPYLYGPEWVLQRWLDGGRDAVRALYHQAPEALLDVLQSSWGSAREQAEHEPAAHEPGTLSHYPAPNVYTTGAAPAPGSQLIPLAHDRLGAYTVYAAARLAGDGAAGQQLALGWRGDQLDVYELDAGGVAARWQVRLESAEQAARFAGLLELNPRISVRRQGVRVVGVVSESGSKPEWLFGPAAR